MEMRGDCWAYLSSGVPLCADRDSRGSVFLLLHMDLLGKLSIYSTWVTLGVALGKGALSCGHLTGLS